MSIFKGMIGSDKRIGDFTCVTHYRKSLNDYFLIDSSSLNLIKDLLVGNFDDSLSDMHCAVVIELVVSTEISSDDAAAVPKLRRTWNRELKELHSSEGKIKELKEIENILQDEPSSLETLN